MISLRFNVHISSSLHKLSALWLPIAAMALLSSCSDDNSPFSDPASGADSEHISFSVSTKDTWNQASSTTGATSVTHSAASVTRGETSAQSRPVKTITLSSPSAEKPLYLIGEESDGITLNSEKGSRATRSELITNDNISSFGVFASLRPDGSSASSESFTPDYMYNIEVTKDNSWAPADEYLWPQKASLHFNAYSPFLTSVATDASEGITSLPSEDATSQLTLSFTTPSDVANQFDLMWATPVDADASPCDLTFNHALTAIKFVAGAELAPCKVTKIEISSVKSSGILNLETGDWIFDDADGAEAAGKVSDFSVAPNLTLSAAYGSSFVAAGTAITSDDQTLLLLPQSLTSDNQITLTIESDGTEYSFSASLDGQTWLAGKTVIYRLSASPASDSLILDVKDAEGNSVTTLQSHYFGGDLNYSIVSNYTPDGSSTEMIPWKAEFVDDDGNPTTRPQWITDFTLSGDGDADCSAPTVMQEPTFAAMSEDTRLLRQAADINATSGFTPYNLSNSSGASAVENTANCYVISAPGKYSLPLVYGNAIKNGAKNEAAYVSSKTTRTLKHFINHLGNAITDPYIYNNSGCAPADAYLVWEGRLCLIGNVELSADGHSIEFEVPATYIRQGNALLAVRDASGNIMWSWQIWVTPYSADDGLRTFSYNGNNYQIMARNIGEVSGGDDTYFEAQTAKVRFTQITPAGIEPKSLVVTINRDSKHVLTPFCYSFYQWGRKDPMISLIKEWYNADHTEITTLPTQAYPEATLGDDYIKTGILRPSVFITDSHSGSEELKAQYYNLWNVNNNTGNSNNDAEIKSIYDPSPVGYKIPGIMMRAFDKIANANAYSATYDNSNPECPALSFALPDGNLLMALLGYRQRSTGANTGMDRNGSVWCNLMSTNAKEARCFEFEITQSGGGVSQFVTNPLLEGFGIRPIKE